MLLQSWKRNGQPKVVVKTETQASLLTLQQHAIKLGLIQSVIKDAGRTQVAPGSITVMAVGPGPKDKIDLVTGSLKLY